MSGKSNLTVGILTPEKEASAYIDEVLKWSGSNSALNVTSIAAPKITSPPTKYGFLFRYLKRVILRLDGKYLQTTSFHAHLQTKKIDPQVSSEATFDYIISPNGSPLPPALLDRTKEGALLLEIGLPLGEPDFFGFWQVYFKEPTTQFKIVLQKKDGTLENILTGNLLTQSSFLLNQAYVCRKAISYLRHFLTNKSENKVFNWSHLKAEHPGPRRSAPGSLGLFTYICKRVFRNLCEKVTHFRSLDQQWNVAFLRSDWPSADLSKGIPLPMTKRQFFADPFVISKGEKDFCFVEEFDFQTGLGHLSVFELSAKEAHPLGAILKEPFHLSFPYLFEYENQLYMCPETSGAKEIRVYKCLEFPMKWALEKTLMANVAAVDTMLFEHQNKWWMLSNIDSMQNNDNCTELMLYFADSPLSDSWQPHPQNPLVIDPLKARNGGFLRDKDTLYRVSQSQKFGIYGAGARIHKVLQLDETQYSETTIASVEPNFFRGIFGTHHMHSNGSLTVYDFCKKTKVDK